MNWVKVWPDYWRHNCDAADVGIALVIWLHRPSEENEKPRGEALIEIVC